MVELVVKGAVGRQRTAEGVGPWGFFRRHGETLGKDRKSAERRSARASPTFKSFPQQQRNRTLVADQHARRRVHRQNDVRHPEVLLKRQYDASAGEKLTHE